VTVQSEPVRRRGLLVPVLAIMILLALLVGLGLWQLERKAWKEALMATLEQRLAQPAGSLPDPGSGGGLDQHDWEFRRVRFTATLRHADEALVYTSGSPLRPDVSGPGYWVFAPAALAGGGGLVAVNRGFVPQGRQDAAARAQGQSAAPVEIVGVLRWPEPGSVFLQADDPARNTFFTRDHRAIAAAKQWGAVLPFYIEQEAPVPPGGLPKPGPLQVKLRNEHLQYALTWFGLAGALAVVSVAWLRRRRQHG
jgi:surfeit locus 1 family protein